MSRKDGISIGFTLQIEQYEPIKYTAFTEEDVENWEGTEEELNFHLAKRCLDRLNEHAPEIAKKIESIKQSILEELSEEDD